MQSGHLEVEDGVGSERRKIRLARVGRRLRRLVCISEDGFATLSALKWLGDIGASFTMLNPNGKVLLVTGPTAPSDARLRRAQALAFGNGVGLEISRKLIDAKLKGQERLVREGLSDSITAQEIASFREKLAAADTFQAIRISEAHAAVAYLAALRNFPVLWPKVDLSRIPDHWRTVGNRHSPLSGGPRLAVTPVHAILNFCFALLESETRRAVVTLGLDAGLGLGLHVDALNRDSLALDVLEPVRVDIERWVLAWIRQEPLRRSDFFETPTGNCRLMAHFCAKLSETAPTWGQLVAPWAEYVARTLWGSTSPSKRARRLSTPLTQQHRRIAKGQSPFPAVKTPKPERLCRGCGKPIRFGRTYCPTCNLIVAREGMIEAAKLGRVKGHNPEARARQAEKQRRHAAAVKSWNPSDKPDLLTEQFYREKIQPRLLGVSVPTISSSLCISQPYAAEIRAGRYIPHPRHWQLLARLTGVGGN
jgi:CRISPR/Cas system-associated endonuclease Cas1